MKKLEQVKGETVLSSIRTLEKNQKEMMNTLARPLINLDQWNNINFHFSYHKKFWRLHLLPIISTRNLFFTQIRIGQKFNIGSV